MIKVCAIQASFTNNYNENIEKTTKLLKIAANSGNQIALLPELFESHYFCKKENDQYFKLAKPAKNNKTIKYIQKLAKELKMVIPVSFFEKDGPNYYNSAAIIDADGNNLGIYRKSHIPDGPGYEEKYYFKPGNTGFKVWNTKYAKIGLGICWDQWFPEVARILVLKGADILFYPSAIGSDPETTEFCTKDLWQKAMIGHSICNIVPIVASNRIGEEDNQIFYGSSFISDHLGNKIAELNDNEENIATASFSLIDIERTRASFGFFRDRRCKLYNFLLND